MKAPKGGLKSMDAVERLALCRIAVGPFSYVARFRGKKYLVTILDPAQPTEGMAPDNANRILLMKRSVGA